MDKKFVVAYGKTLSTKKGIFGAGEEVDAGHFPSEAHLDELVEAGFVQPAAEFIKIKHYRGQDVGDAPKPGIVPEAEPPTPEPPKPEPPKPEPEPEPEPKPELKLKGAAKRVKR